MTFKKIKDEITPYPKQVACRRFDVLDCDREAVQTGHEVAEMGAAIASCDTSYCRGFIRVNQNINARRPSANFLQTILGQPGLAILETGLGTGMLASGLGAYKVAPKKISIGERAYQFSAVQDPFYAAIAHDSCGHR